jgi:hypothetical protein
MIGVNEVTGEQWRNWSAEERRAFERHWKHQGIFWFACLDCGFPVQYGGAPCEACDPELHERWKAGA